VRGPASPPPTNIAFERRRYITELIEGCLADHHDAAWLVSAVRSVDSGGRVAAFYSIHS
jgi:hypothetical protein